MGSEIYFNDSNMDYIESNILGHEFIHDFSIGIVDRLEKLNTRIKKLNKTIKSSFEQYVSTASAGGGEKDNINLHTLFVIDDNIIHICTDIIRILINEQIIHVNKDKVKKDVSLPKDDIILLNDLLSSIQGFRSELIELIDTDIEISTIEAQLESYQSRFDILIQPLDDTHSDYIFGKLLKSADETIEIPELTVSYNRSFNEQMEYENVFIGKGRRNKLQTRELTRIKNQVSSFIHILDVHNFGPISNYNSDKISDFFHNHTSNGKSFRQADRTNKKLFTYMTDDTLISKRNMFMRIYNKARIQKILIHFNLLKSVRKSCNFRIENISDNIHNEEHIPVENIQLVVKRESKHEGDNEIVYDNVASHLMDTLIMNDGPFIDILSTDEAQKYENISHVSLLFLNYYYDAFIQPVDNEWDHRLAHCAMLDTCIMEHKMKLFGYITDNKSMAGGLRKPNLDMMRQFEKSEVEYTKDSLLESKNVPITINTIQEEDEDSTPSYEIHHENICYAFHACIQTNKNETVAKLYDLYSKLYFIYYDLMKDRMHPMDIINSKQIEFLLKLGFINEFKQNDYILSTMECVPLYSNIPFTTTKNKMTGGLRRILTRNRNISLRELRIISRSDKTELVEMTKIIEEKKRLRKELRKRIEPKAIEESATVESVVESVEIGIDEMKAGLSEQFDVQFEEKDDEVFKLMFDSNEYTRILNKSKELTGLVSETKNMPEYLVTDLFLRNSVGEKYLQLKHVFYSCEEKYTTMKTITSLSEIVDELLSVDEYINFIKTEVSIPYLRPLSTYIEKVILPDGNVATNEESIVNVKMTMMHNMSDVFVYVGNILSRIDMLGDVYKTKIHDMEHELETFGKHIIFDSMFELFNSVTKSKGRVLDLEDRKTINHVAQMISRIAMKYAIGRDGHKSMKMTKDELISYISSEKSDSPLNRFNNDFLKLQLNILSVWGLYSEVKLLSEFDDKSTVLFPEFTLEKVPHYNNENYDTNILNGFLSIVSSNEEYNNKRIYNDMLHKIVLHPKLMDSKYVINNSADLINSKLLQSADSDEDAININYLKSKYFCPLSSVIDAQSTCNLNMAINRDGAEFGSFHVKLLNSNKTRKYEVKSTYNDELYKTKSDAHYLYSENEITLQKEDIYLHSTFNTYLYNFKHTEDDDDTHEKMLNSMKGAELSARNVYKLLISKITNLVCYHYDEKKFILNDVWNTLEVTYYQDILQLSMIKSVGDIFQELNTVTKSGGYTDVKKAGSTNIYNAKSLHDSKYDELDGSKKVLKYSASGDALRIGVMGDRPSGTRLAFILLNATGESEVNELSLGGFVSPMVGLPVEELKDGKVVTKTIRHVEPRNTLLIGRNMDELSGLASGASGGNRKDTSNIIQQNRKTRKKRNL